MSTRAARAPAYWRLQPPRRVAHTGSQLVPLHRDIRVRLRANDHNCDVHCGHRLALMEIVEAQNGHSLVVAAAAGAGCSVIRWMRLTCLTSTNTANAMIRNVMTSFNTCP